MRQEQWLPAHPRSVADARALVRQVADECELEPPACADLVMAVSEAVANAVEHGTPCRDGEVRLALSVDDECVVAEVCDCGEFEPASSVAAEDEFATRGRGLPIIAALADRMELEAEPDVTRLRVTKWRHAA